MFHKILVAVDGSKSALKAAGLAGEIARKFGSEVTLLYVPHFPASVLAAWSMTGLAASERIAVQAAEEAVRELFRVACESLGSLPAKPEEKTIVGHPAEIICQLAKESGYDLIVMGRRGLSEVSGFLMGSVSDKVSHHAHCPVLIVH